MIALIMLLFGVLYLGKYQNSIIETKLENFEREAKIIALAINTLDVNGFEIEEKIAPIISDSDQTIKIFDQNGALLHTQKSNYQNITKQELRSIKLLKDTASFVTSFLPDTKAIPVYPHKSTPDLKEALSGFLSLSAWQDENEEILLSAGIPLIQNASSPAAIVIIRHSSNIKEAIGEVWQGVLKIFAATLLREWANVLASSTLPVSNADFILS